MSLLKPYNSLEEIKSDIQRGAVNCKQLVEGYLHNIKENSHLNAFLEVYETEALQRAEEIDQKIANGTAGPLAGMVVGLKDVLCYKDHGLQASSKILDKFISQFSGTAVQRIVDADAIIIGRQSCDEFAMGSSNENSAFGPVRNAADPTRVPGGSSGASAVAVQANMCLASLGSDTGGSVRQPAAFCGVVGLKPTYSRVSRFGLAAYASSFDCIGPITRSIKDAALLLEIIAGYDDFDSTVSTKPVQNYSQQLIFNKKSKIGYLKESVESSAIAPAIREKTLTVLEKLKAEGHEVVPVELPLMDYILPTYYILTTAEASSNLSRYDGVRFGYRSSNTTDLESMYKKSRAEGFGKEVKKRIMLGTFVLSASYFDAYFTKAQRVRRLIKEKTEALLHEYDFIIMPTTPTTAYKIGQFEGDPLAMYLGDIFTVQANLAGIPALSIPNGFDEASLPIGLQISTKHFGESDLLAFGQYITSLN